MPEKEHKEKDQNPFEKEVMEKDAINRIAWGKSLKPKEYDICYIDRFTNERSKLNYSETKVEGDYLFQGENRISVHRIRKITHRGIVA